MVHFNQSSSLHLVVAMFEPFDGFHVSNNFFNILWRLGHGFLGLCKAIQQVLDNELNPGIFGAIVSKFDDILVLPAVPTFALRDALGQLERFSCVVPLFHGVPPAVTVAGLWLGFFLVQLVAKFNEQDEVTGLFAN